MIGQVTWRGRVTDVHRTEEDLGSVTILLYHSHKAVTLPLLSSFSLEPGDYVSLELTPDEPA